MELKPIPVELAAQLRIILDRVREVVPPPYQYVTIITIPSPSGGPRIIGVDKDRISVGSVIRLLEETLERVRQEVQ
jgi:hypothetical protein